MKTANISNFFHDKPLFGLDIGFGSLKVMQLAEPLTKAGPDQTHRLIGYGTAKFDIAALQDGVITQPEIIAKATQELFAHHLIGDITTRRAALALPAYRTFTRTLQLPKLQPKELKEAVELEAEQYISMPLEDLYLDYQIIRQTEETTELFVVAVPQAIVNSYLDLSQLLGIEPVLVEPTISSASRVFSLDAQSDVPTFLIDFGSLSSNISIFDKNILVTGTVQGGGANFTELIGKALNVSPEEAGQIKTRYGLDASKKQAAIREALEPVLAQIIKEIRRMMRYYEERYGTERPITQIVTLGGGANMPGLNEYLTATLRMAVRRSDPWQTFNFKGLQPPSSADKPMYATAVGLSLASPNEVFTS